MCKEITLGSLFSGIGGFEYAGSRYGFEPVWASEIEPAPIRITQNHFPNMKHVGDILQLKGRDLPPVDIITGGSPCTSLSIAGKQAGINLQCPKCQHIENPYSGISICPQCGTTLSLTESGLFLHQIRIIKEMREATNGKYPKILVWENVSAALSSNNGDDFYCVLSELCGLMGDKLPTARPERWTAAGEILGESYSLAWRTFDAQYWGVPQRRRRIFLVMDFRGQCARDILFKQNSLRRHSPQSPYPWKSYARKAKECSGSTNSETQCRIDPPMAVATQQVNAEIMIDKSPTLTSANGTSGSNRVFIVDSVNTAYGICSLASNCMKSDNPNSGYYETQVAKTLDCNGGNPSCNQGGNVIVSQPVYCIQGNCIDRADTAGCNGRGWTEDVCYTLTTIDRPAVAYAIHENDRSECRLSADKSFALTTGGGKHGQGYPAAMINTIVRRLTPLECERLQGFPDNWTAGESDSARYKALGNSVAIPCVSYIMSGIADILEPLE